MVDNILILSRCTLEDYAKAHAILSTAYANLSELRCSHTDQYKCTIACPHFVSSWLNYTTGVINLPYCKLHIKQLEKEKANALQRL